MEKEKNEKPEVQSNNTTDPIAGDITKPCDLLPITKTEDI